MTRVLLFLLVSLFGFLPVRAQVPDTPVTGARVECSGGTASVFPCNNVDLLAFLPIQDIGGRDTVITVNEVERTYSNELNDIWGWTDPQTGREYALVGRTDGTAFVDVTDPLNPVYLGKLPKPDGTPFSPWRDVKVYQDHAFVVADAAGQHGMQVFDLTRLRGVQTPPVQFEETAHYGNFGSAHNIVINEDTGFAYAVGITGPQIGGTGCGPGLHMIDIRDPENPSFAGCFNSSLSRGYTHDAQCVAYDGPDPDYQGREICVGADEVGIAVSDVTDKSSPVEISVATYPSTGYTHQGWFSEDQRYFFQDDELDELQGSVRSTRTLVWDVEDLDEPQLLTEYFGPTGSIDHNLYVVGHYVFEADYTSGLRILDISEVLDGADDGDVQPREVAFFDTYPQDDRAQFHGAWSVYPFFESGVVVVSGIGEGLFVLDPVGSVLLAAQDGEAPGSFALSAAYPNPFNPSTAVTVTLPEAQRVRVAVFDVLGRQVVLLHDGALQAGTHRLTFEAADLPSGTYLIRATTAHYVRTRVATLAK